MNMPPNALALNLAANLSWLYTDLPFLDRFEAAARDGFAGVECLFPHEHDDAEVAARLRDTGLQLVLFNARPGDWARGDRGLAGVPGREADFRRSIDEALDRAHRLMCPRVHVMAGLCVAPTLEERQHARALYLQQLGWAAERAEQAGVTLMIEPINPRDMPGYLLQLQSEAHAVVQTIGSAALQVQMDIYHCQIVEGDVTTKLRQYLPTGRVGHLQIAAVPDRGEPGQGELSYVHVLEEVQRLGYGGWIGLEYRPRNHLPGGTSSGLSWLGALQGSLQQQKPPGMSDSGSIDDL